MKYYKVKKEYDDKYYYEQKNGYKKLKGVLVANELYTPAERKQITLPDECFDIVEVSRKHIYFFFGCRYEQSRDR